MTLKKEDLPLFTPWRATLYPMPPLQFAVYNIYYGGVKPILALLEAGAELDAVDEYGNTALDEAVQQREPDIYALLVQAGANQHIIDKGGSTPAVFYEKVFGMTYEEKFKGMKIDADFFRR